jgi:DNA-binding transcriptional MerR regulator
VTEETNEGAPTDKGYLALGELLELLRPEFPDLTVSKIRFLEQQGLLAPERTPSGYRKFYPSHAARLRWILVQQEGTYLPLREIKARLLAAETEGLFATEDRQSPPVQEHLAPVTSMIRDSSTRKMSHLSRNVALENGDQDEGDDEHGSLRGAPTAALGERRHPAGLARRAATAFASMNGPEGSEAHPSSRPSASTIARAEAGAKYHDGADPGRGQLDSSGSEVDSSKLSANGESTASAADAKRRTNLRSVPPSSPVQLADRVNNLPLDNGAGPLASAADTEVAGTVVAIRPESLGTPPAESAGRFTFAELAAAAKLTAEELRLIEQFGLIVGRPVAGQVYYDDDALAAAKLAKLFEAFGVEPRHLRIFRTAVDREADFYAQVVSPLVYRREERSRQQALTNLAELHQLGAALREATLRQVLRTTFDLG